MRELGVGIITAAGLPAELGDLWVVEAVVDSNGAAVFNIDRLVNVLATNHLQVCRGWSSGYVPVALCKTVEDATDTVEFLNRKKKALADLHSPEAVGQELGKELSND
ncbi:MAG: hypothetical protein RBS72_21985 [Sedimentisphaerales bacterium]|jgi:hypothetical protein|nr:hypothetical protein [Sedimentisphaerales bacterium]HRV49595.1 hypothetical protein [Sedimentisphaerales bacterium]